MRKTEIDLTKGKIIPTIIRFAIPLILTSILQTTFSTVDIAVVGQFCGSVSVAAIGSTAALSNLLLNLFIGMSSGVTATVSQSLGAKKNDDANLYTHTAIALSITLGSIIAVIGIIISRSALIALGTPKGEVLDLAVSYFNIYALCIPSVLTYNFSSAVIRANGDTEKPFIFICIGGVSNIILNLVFVLLFKMNVVGVAIATVLSNYASSALAVRHLMKCDNPCKVNLKKIKISKPHLNSIMKVGLPVCVQCSMASIPNMMIQSHINLYGVNAIAGNSAAAGVSRYLEIVSGAATSSTINFVSRNYGAKLYNRIKEGVRCLLVISPSISLIFGILIYIFRVPVLSVFIPDNVQAIEYGSLRLLYLVVPHLIGNAVEVYSAALRGLSKSVLPTAISIFSTFFIRILWLMFIYPLYPSIECVYFTFPLTWGIAYVLVAISYYKTSKKLFCEK